MVVALQPSCKGAHCIHGCRQEVGGHMGTLQPSGFPPLFLLMLLVYINAKQARPPALNLCPGASGARSPSPSLPPSWAPAQTSPRHRPDLSPLDHPEHYWGLKVASGRRDHPSPGEQLGEGGGGPGCPLFPLPDGPPALCRAEQVPFPEATVGPRLQTTSDAAKAHPWRAGLPIIQ